MAKITIQKGQTLSQIAKANGTTVAELARLNGITDVNRIQAGATLNLPDVKMNSVTPVLATGQVDISKVVEDVKPFQEKIVPVKTVQNAFGGSMTDAQLQQLANVNPELADTVMNVLGYSGAPNADGTQSRISTKPVEVDFSKLAPEEQLSRTATTIRNEISTLEAKMANRETDRNEALDDAGVFDDMKKLTALKAELKTAQDRDIEIPIEIREQLRGRQATKTEFNQALSPQLEKNALRTLAASRNVAALTDVINTNISIVDAKVKADTARDEFLYKQKQTRLENVEKIYGNIITEKQKAAIEEKKFQNDLLLENIKADNSLRGDLIKEIAKKGIGGAQLQGLMDASIDELVSFNANIGSPKNWSTMTFEEAAMTLDKDSFAKFEAYKEWEKTVSEEEKAAVTEALGAQQGAKNIISTIEQMLNDKEGLENSVGVGPLGNRDVTFFGAGSETTKFRALAKTLTSQATLDALMQLKASGATLGAVSEKELEILQNAGNSLGTIYKDGVSTGRFKMKEADFIEMLETMRVASMKTYIASAIGKDAYARAGYQNADFDTIQKRYTDLLENGTKPQTNYYQQDQQQAPLKTTFETLKREEGLRTEAYQDQTGKWTIGFGTTTINGRPVQKGDKLTAAQAEALMQKQVVENYTTFSNKVTTEVTPNQFAALTSFEYNLGPGVWEQPTGQKILSLVNAGRYTEAGQLMLQFNKSKNPRTGQLETNPALAQRRLREARMLLA